MGNRISLRLDQLDSEPSLMEESYERLLAHRAEGLSSRYSPLAGFSVTQLRADPSPERFPAQVNPGKHGINIQSNVGNAELEIDSRRRRNIYRPGDFALVPRGARTNGNVYRSTEFVHILMEESCIERVSEESDGPGRVELLPILQGRDELLRHLAHTLVGELAKGPAVDALYADILTRAIIAHTVKNMGAAAVQPKRDHRLALSTVGMIIDYVAENLGGPIRLDDLAAATGVGASKLHTQFKRAVGVPLHQFVIQQRVKRARELLSGSKLPVAEIAYRTGFSDQSHLTRVLRRHTGLTPRAFRQA